MNSVLKVKSISGKKEILLNEVPISEYCLSCDIHIDSNTTSATLVFLNEGIEIEADEAVKASRYKRNERRSFRLSSILSRFN